MAGSFSYLIIHTKKKNNWKELELNPGPLAPLVPALLCIVPIATLSTRLLSLEAAIGEKSSTKSPPLHSPIVKVDPNLTF